MPHRPSPAECGRMVEMTTIRALPPTSESLRSDETRPYFLWWTDVTVGGLKQRLASDDLGVKAFGWEPYCARRTPVTCGSSSPRTIFANSGPNSFLTSDAHGRCGVGFSSCRSPSGHLQKRAPAGHERSTAKQSFRELTPKFLHQSTHHKETSSRPLGRSLSRR